MQTDFFRAWLRANKTYPEYIINTRIANCKKVEKYYGDLDKFVDECGEEWLLQELSYSTKNERDNIIPKIIIDGNIRNGYATLKSATKLYFEMYTD